MNDGTHHKKKEALQFESKQIDILYDEYKHRIESIERRENTLIQILSVGTGLIGGATLALAMGTINNYLLTIAWMIPLVFLIFYSITIFLLANQVNDIQSAKILAHQIGNLLKQPPILLLKSMPNTPSSLFFSTSKGNIKIRLLVLITSLINIVFFLAIMYLCWSVIYDYSHLAGSLFLLVYCSLTLIFIYIYTAVFFDLPELYLSFEKQIKESGQYSIVNNTSAKFNSLFWVLLPRPFDFLAKSPNFILGFILALGMVSIDPEQISLISSWFGSSSSQFTNLSNLPQFYIYLLGVVYLIFTELFLQQGKLLWDDIRDKERDKQLPLNQYRAISKNEISDSFAIMQMVIRWLLPFIFALLLHQWSLLGVYCFISIHQIVYTLSKSKANKHPILILSLLAFNAPLRFFAGTLVITFSPWEYYYLFTTILVFYFCSFGVMSAIWRIEADYQYSSGVAFSRPQGEYFLYNGFYWQRIGFISGLLSLFFILSDFFINFVFLPPFSIFNAIPVKTIVIGIVSITSITIFVYGLIVVQFFVKHILNFILNLHKVFKQKILSITIKDYYEKVEFKIALLSNKFLDINTKIYFNKIQKGLQFLSPIFFLIFIFNLYYGYTSKNEEFLVISFVLFVLGLMFQFEGITYPEYALFGLREKLSTIFKIWFIYIFKSNSGISFKFLIMSTFSNNGIIPETNNIVIQNNSNKSND